MPSSRTARPMELLAPAGSPDALRAALAAGADAVYLAGRRFGARASAENFDGEGLAWARRVTRAAGRRLYVAVNTLVFDDEWPALLAHLDVLAGLGVDALIVQDLGVLAALRKRGHALPAHLSTQAAWDGAGGAELLASLGVERVILPRETPLETVRRIAKEAPFAVEVFVHGASCYSVSGRCWWSATLGPRSGNRGTCAQPCRRAYTARLEPEAPEPTDTRPWFSPKDLRLLEHLAALREAGVRSLKIEGRLKDPGYVASVTRAYRATLDGAEDAPRRIAALGAVFARATGAGFLGGAPRDWRTGTEVGHAGVEVGRVAGTSSRGGRVAVQLSEGLSAGDGLAWDEDGRRRGARVTWVDRPGPGSRELRLRGGAPTQTGARLWRTSAGAAPDPFEGWDPAWDRVPIALAAEGRAGSPLRLLARGDALSVEVTSAELLQRARGQGLEALLPERFGHLPLPLEVATLDLDGLAPGLFLAPKALKALRRDVLAAIAAATAPPLTSIDPSPREVAPPRDPTGFTSPHGIRLRLFRREDLAALSGLHPAGGWILPAESARPEDLTTLDGPLGYWLPPTTGPDAAELLAPLVEALPPEAELLCLSWEAFSLAARFPARRFRLDWTFNLANKEAVALVRGAGLAATASPETPSALPGALALARQNPLVSLSRFPPGTGDPSRLQSSHGDRLTRLGLGRGCWGLFLHRQATPLPVPPGPLGAQLDLVLLEPEDPDRVAAWLAAHYLT